MAVGLGTTNDRAYGSTTQGEPPTTELGAMVQGSIPLPGWAQMPIDPIENVPELLFPQSVRTYSFMMNDSQIAGLHAGATMPIERYEWMIDPNGCDRTKVESLAKDLGLPIKGDNPDQQKGRSKKRFSFANHLHTAMKSIVYGFYPFEQVGKIGPDGLWHLNKLAERPPVTVEEIAVADDGGLVYIRQNITSRNNVFGAIAEIPVDRLVMYSWDKEGANWQGKSMLRAIYRNWLVKDRLVRVDAVKHERNGMGVPVGFGSPGMTDDELRRLGRTAASYKAGEAAGAALPNGADLKLLGVSGSLPDTIASLNWHNEEMSRRFLMMFIQLGSTLHGSRALGKDFVDYFQLSQEQIANWFKNVFTEHVIEDYWDWNYGENEEFTPRLVYKRSDDPRLAIADLALMIQNDVVQVDDGVEQSVREAMGLPVFDPAEERSYLKGNSPEEKMKQMQEMKQPPSPPGDQPGKPSTQPGNADPKYPDQNPDAKARRDDRGVRAGGSPPRSSGSDPRLDRNAAREDLGI